MKNLIIGLLAGFIGGFVFVCTCFAAWPKELYKFTKIIKKSLKD